MNLLPLFQWFEATAIGTAVRESLWLFPVIQCIHLLALAVLGGAVLVVDLRLLGIGLRDESATALAQELHPWLVRSLTMMIASGIPMFLSESLKCYYSPPFWWKMGLLLLAVIFAFTVRRQVLAGSGGPLRRRLTAVASLALWVGVGLSGRWIAFY
jgi:hypothetical protein